MAADVKILMDGDCKKSLKIAIIEFYKLNLSKGKAYMFKHFKNGDVGRATIYRRIKIKQKEINQDIVIKMFEKLKGKVYMANEKGLTSLLKI